MLLDSSDPTVATVQPDGTVEGRRPGTATVTAYAFGGAQASCTVDGRARGGHGRDAAAESLTMQVGDSERLAPALIPENATDPRSDVHHEDEGVVTVDRRGELTAVGEGTARVVVVTADGGWTDVVFVTVESAPRRYRALLVGEQN